MSGGRWPGIGIAWGGGGGSGPPFAESFTYSNGELASVSSNKWVKLTGTDSSVASNAFTIEASTVYLYATETDTVDQYAAIQRSEDDNNTYAGVYVRQETTNGTSTKAYALRYNTPTGNLVLRHCTGSSCTDIRDLSQTVAAGDSFGLEVIGTGADTVWLIYYWSQQAPPARGSWGNCIQGFYVEGGSAPGCNSNAFVTALGANYADAGKYCGIYSGGGAQTFDNWMAGDVE